MKNERSVEKTSAPSSLSLIFFLLDTLADKIYHGLIEGFFGKIFTAYSAEQRAFERSTIKTKVIGAKPVVSVFQRVREFLAKSFETSFFLRKLNRIGNGFLSIPLKSFGNFFLFFGIYTTLIFFLKWIIPEMESADIAFGFCGLLSCLIGLPMMLSRNSIARSILESKIASFIFVNLFGFRREALETPPRRRRAVSNVMVVLGMILGLLTFLVDPLYILMALGFAVGLVLLFFMPEMGIVLSVLLLPFLYFLPSPSISLGLLISATTISYIVKIVRGKRIFRFELIDIAVLAFGLILLSSGFATAGGKDGYNEVLITFCLLCGYFLTVNLMRTRQWLKRCSLCMVFSGTVTALCGIIQYTVGAFNSGAWLDPVYFADIRGRADALFENPNVLASYLVLVFPFALAHLVRAASGKERILFSFSVLSILLCTVVTWSRGAWLGLLVGFLVFAIMHSKKTVRYLFLAVLFIPLLSFLLPETVTKRFMSIGSLSDSSSLYRVYTWRGSFRVIKEFFFGGIGYGTSAYQSVYPQFAYAGMEAAEHSHNLWLQVWIGVGIGGVLLLALALFFFFQMNLEHIKNSKNAFNRSMIVASICAIAAALVMGCFDFIWFNYRVFFIFWFIIGLSCAYTRLGQDELRRIECVEEAEKNTATLDLPL